MACCCSCCSNYCPGQFKLDLVAPMLSSDTVRLIMMMLVMVCATAIESGASDDLDAGGRRPSKPDRRRPNIIIMFADNLGYGMLHGTFVAQRIC
eukprot:SAG31_NODE_10495_length_1132_cov_0.970958_1_plen_94_part_00